MPIVVFGPVIADESEGLEAVSLQITVQDGDEALVLFDQVEVWRSVSDTSGPFEELTDVRTTFKLLGECSPHTFWSFFNGIMCLTRPPTSSASS